MANVFVEENSLQDIADAIREKKGKEETYKPSEMGDAIRDIEVGSGDISKFGILNEVKGTNIVTCDYVNENEHNVEVKLSSDTVTDFSGVEVKVIGKNLFDSSQEGTLVGANRDMPVNLVLGETYTLSASISNSGAVIVLRGFATENDTSGVELIKLEAGTNTSGRISKTKICNTEYHHYAIRFYTALQGFYDIQLEQNTVATDYEPYTEKTYTANANGTVDGITSISPRMNIICEGVDISAKYYHCPTVEYDRFWDIFQNYGNRISYRQAFNDYGRNWNDKNYNPKYPITIKYADYGGNNVFHTCIITDTKVDIICIDGVILTSTFTNAKELKTIKKLVVNKDVTYTNTFNVCNSLENITFEGEIGSSINFQWSTLLTVDSAKNIIQCLANYKGTDNEGTQTLTFASNIWEALEAEGDTSPNGTTWELYIESKGWLYT